MPRDVHGTARLETDEEGQQILVIVTDRKKGKKMAKHERKYRVVDVRPDPGVANPAFALYLEDEPEKEPYHVSQREFGACCDCPDGHFRRENDRTKCKHVKALQAVGLMPKDPLAIDDQEEPLPW